MRILIISDTHRKDQNLDLVLQKEGSFDLLIHLGDVEGSQNYIQMSAKCPVEIVSGNNDFLGDLPKEKEITIGKYKVLLTHGHDYYVSLDPKLLRREAKARGFDIAMYGHTHRPKIDTHGGVTLVNPGSLSYPRQEGRKPSYIIMTLDEEENITYEIKYL
ncbi:MAG: metallophosphoesterase [Eubacteriales bacterium]|nr:metallophosphoesterase [Eubacteriales bacterium]